MVPLECLVNQNLQERVSENCIKEITKQSTQRFVRIIEQPIFEIQPSFYCHIEKRTNIK